MPSQPIFRSSRAQSVAVAAATGLILLCAAGLAYLQAGDGTGNQRDRSGQARRSPAEHTGHPTPGSLSLDLPKDWNQQEDIPDTVALTDPDRPSRHLLITTLRIAQRTSPKQLLQQFIAGKLGPRPPRGLSQAAPAIEFSIVDHGLSGAEFIGVSDASEEPTSPQPPMQHLIACITADGTYYWLIYLRDTLDAADDPRQTLQANAALLRTIYQSARHKPG